MHSNVWVYEQILNGIIINGIILNGIILNGIIFYTLKKAAWWSHKTRDIKFMMKRRDIYRHCPKFKTSRKNKTKQ